MPAYPIAGTELFASAVTTLSEAPLVMAPVSAPISIAGFSQVCLTGVAAAGNDGNIERVSDGAVIGSWTGGVAGQAYVDVSADYTDAVDLVATSVSTNTARNVNKPMGFAVDFDIGGGSTGSVGTLIYGK